MRSDETTVVPCCGELMTAFEEATDGVLGKGDVLVRQTRAFLAEQYRHHRRTAKRDYSREDAIAHCHDDCDRSPVADIADKGHSPTSDLLMKELGNDDRSDELVREVLAPLIAFQ